MLAVRVFEPGDLPAAVAIVKGLPDYFTADVPAHGHGTLLLGHVMENLSGAGVSVVEVKTLDRSSGYQPYEATRAFWEHNGFVKVDTIDPLPGWQPGNPAAIYAAAIRPTWRPAGTRRA